MIWSLPMLASGLVWLLRYGFGSLFVIGEDVAVVLLRSTGADIAGTLQRLHASPLLSAGEAGGGMMLCALSAGTVQDRPIIAAALALASAGEAWWYGLPIVAALLIPAAICALIAMRG